MNSGILFTFAILGMCIWYLCFDYLKTKEKKDYEDKLNKKTNKIASTFQTKGFSNFIKVNNKILFINDSLNKWAIYSLDNDKIDVFDYIELVEYSIYKDNQSMVTGTVGESIVGGLLFGGLGALAGSSAPRNIVEKSKSLTVKITVNRLDNPLIYLSIYHFNKPVQLLPMQKDEYNYQADKINSYLLYIKKNAETELQNKKW